MASGCPVQHHGVTKALGCQHTGFGSFGFLFDKPLPALDFSDELLVIIGAAGNLMDDETRDSLDAAIPAGYTFFAQFIDHDITLDTQSQLNQPGQDPQTIKNLRTSGLDLDSIYGFGPGAHPHLYDINRSGFVTTGANQGRPWDLARTPTGAALIGDPRNDENLFINQMHLLWLRFHNAMLLSNLGAGHTNRARFEEVEQRVRHHFQFILLHDFLCRVCHPETYQSAVQKIEEAAEEQRKALDANKAEHLPKAYPLVFRHKNKHGMPMPIEFSVAAFRFGHTTVRDAYPANESQLDIELFDERFGTNGFSALPQELGVDWRFQLEVDPCIDPVRMKAFDHLLPNELMAMPDPVVGKTSANNRSLAFRNLARGRSLGLASGEDVAKALAPHYPTISPLTLTQLFAPEDFPGKAALAERGQELAKEAGGTPLFFYLMREAQLTTNGASLGPVGSAILLEVFGRMLLECSTSFLYNRVDGKFVDFEPDHCVTGEDHEELKTKHEQAKEYFKNQRASYIHTLHRKRKETKGKNTPKAPAKSDVCKPKLELADLVRYINSVDQRFGTGCPCSDE